MIGNSEGGGISLDWGHQGNMKVAFEMILDLFIQKGMFMLGRGLERGVTSIKESFCSSRIT